MRHPEADSLALDLRAIMADAFTPRDIRRGRDGLTWEFYGKLVVPANLALDQWQAPFGRLGYAPFVFQAGADDVVLARPAAELLPTRPAWGLHLLLLLVTFATLTMTGALLQAARAGPLTVTLGSILDALEQHGGAGLTFAAALLFILGAHELGHYLVARRYAMLITPPFFLPSPPPPYGLGTLGAVIAMRSPVPHRRALFDVALAGPLAGLVVALPILALGLRSASVAAFAVPVTPSLLASGLAWLLRGPLPDGVQLDWFDPLLFAAWLGLQITAINLLPIGQLDGGHLTYAALGRAAIWLGRLAWLVLVALTPLAPTWGLYAIIVLVVGLGHPPPQDDITPLDRSRHLWAIAALALLALTFSVRPIP
ncbi:MAG: site-2 protease family protein [Anaerolineae bacterium]|nr:site-2 protease family protein [Anaerolineae bacterium]